MNNFSPETPKSQEIEKKPIRIIYIEDNEEFRDFINEEFKKFPADVELVASFSSTEEAKEYLMRLRDEKKDLPDMIVSDNSLGAGKATGIQFAKDLKKQGFEIPFVLFTNDVKAFRGFSATDINKMGLTRVVDKLESANSLVGVLKEINLSSSVS